MLEKINEFKKLIENSKNILLINHIRMDPDAF
jgi:nanoRNase/pAp phosphatase (c-di-AMP/oligoRNAs hydrolase)